VKTSNCLRQHVAVKHCYEIKNLLYRPPDLFIVSNTKLAFNIVSLKNIPPLPSRSDFSDYILWDILLILVFNELTYFCKQNILLLSLLVRIYAVKNSNVASHSATHNKFNFHLQTRSESGCNRTQCHILNFISASKL
jgi:hypothetical protein